MLFRLEIETGNAAILNGDTAALAALIRQSADKVARGRVAGSIVDANGNTVGTYHLEDN